jgi:uncharacterized protein (DUF433 family)
MTQIDRITLDPAVMGGKPCIRGQRVTVAMVLGLLATGSSRDEILKSYPYLESKDIDQCIGAERHSSQRSKRTSGTLGTDRRGGTDTT